MFNHWQDDIFANYSDSPEQVRKTREEVRKKFPGLYKKIRSGEMSVNPEGVAWYHKLSEISKFVPIEIRNFE